MVVRRGVLRRASFVVGGLLGLMLLGPSGTASAGDSGSEHETAGPWNWSGLYFGAHAGYGSGDMDYTLNVAGAAAVTNEKVSHDVAGWLYGGHLGVQHQYGRVVAGLEVSYSDLDLSDTVASQTGADRHRTIDINSLFTATARLGLASDRVLAYVKGGYATADIDTVIFKGSSPKSVTSGWEGGWTAGAGIEFSCLSRFILGLEYNYVKLDVDDRVGWLVSDGKPFAHSDIDDEIHSVVGRVSYKFGHEPAPAPLK